MNDKLIPTDKLVPLDSMDAAAAQDLIKAIAMDIGKNVSAYIDVMYHEAVKASPSTFLLSVRNSIYNEIMAAIKVNDEKQVLARLANNAAFRRQWRAAYRKIRKEQS